MDPNTLKHNLRADAALLRAMHPDLPDMVAAMLQAADEIERLGETVDKLHDLGTEWRELSVAELQRGAPDEITLYRRTYYLVPPNTRHLVALARKIIEAADAGRMLNPKPLAVIAREVLAQTTEEHAKADDGNQRLRAALVRCIGVLERGEHVSDEEWDACLDEAHAVLSRTPD